MRAKWTGMLTNEPRFVSSHQIRRTDAGSWYRLMSATSQSTVTEVRFVIIGGQPWRASRKLNSRSAP